jgi:hypothetical protein
VYCSLDGNVAVDYYAINIVVPQKSLYKSIQQLRSVSSLPLAFLWKLFNVGNYLFVGQQFNVVFEPFEADSYSRLSILLM